MTPGGMFRNRTADAKRKPYRQLLDLLNRAKPFKGSTPHAWHQAMNSATSTRRFAVSQLYTHDCGFRSLAPSSRWVSPASSRSARRNGGSRLYRSECCALVMPG